MAIRLSYIVSEIRTLSTKERAVTVITVLCALFLFAFDYRLYSFSKKERDAQLSYYAVKNAVYREMSRPGGRRRFIMKNISGPGRLPDPLQEVVFKDGIVLDYLIRIRDLRLEKEPIEQLRFQVRHKDGRYAYRYEKIRGVVVEQVYARSQDER
ncbi:MAG: hypothetical protein D6808_08045 [Candidatus Dadabacteria bacterium]|nr:MAG: hypothetical protein D6808_08045 [Candidatus Dadabacteria bacterium]